MNNDAKNILMQYLYRIAEFHEIQEPNLISFKKRSNLMEQLQQKDKEAWVVVNELFEAFIKFDRIENDKEKFDKARLLWQAEHAQAEKEKVNSEMHLIDFCKRKGIKVGELNLTV